MQSKKRQITKIAAEKKMLKIKIITGEHHTVLTVLDCINLTFDML